MKPLQIGNLKIPIPIIQGGMGVGVSLSGLASAVANMGGVGVIASVGLGLIHYGNKSNYKQNNIDGLRKEIRKARSQTNGILGINILSVLTNFSDLVKTSIDEGIDVIFSGAGLPLDLPKYLGKNINTKIVPIVSSARAASIISNKWKQNYDYLPDALVIEGPKAGGHLGFKHKEIDDSNYQLENLVPDVIEVTNEINDKYQTKIPLIAAGGIYTGSDIHKFFQMGVSGVQLGTRFVGTKECDASIEFKKAFVLAKKEDIEIIQSPVGMPGRAIFNKFLVDAYEGKHKPKVCKHHCIKSCDPKTTIYCIADALVEAYKGNFENGFAFSGKNAERVTNITTVSDVFAELKNEYQEAKSINEVKIN